MQGVITTSSLISLAPIIISEFGVLIWLKCIYLATVKEKVTFLEIVVKL